MSIFDTKPNSEVSALVVKRDAKKEEIEYLTKFIELVQALLESTEPAEQMQALLKSMEDRKAKLEEKVSNYQEDLKSLQANN